MKYSMRITVIHVTNGKKRNALMGNALIVDPGLTGLQ
jgi:hypothetical protein